MIMSYSMIMIIKNLMKKIWIKFKIIWLKENLIIQKEEILTDVIEKKKNKWDNLEAYHHQKYFKWVSLKNKFSCHQILISRIKKLNNLIKEHRL